ncbi:MAG: hypothetical protein HY820_04455 [Acidobacteria bacterium]|nr:hypothetical protein [Acidobacteriota bacterium]
MKPAPTAFLLGVIAAMSATAAVFFLKFWRTTKDPLFVAFACYFAIEGGNKIALIFMERPNEGSQWIYGARLVASLLILGAILRKNYGREGPTPPKL